MTCQVTAKFSSSPSNIKKKILASLSVIIASSSAIVAIPSPVSAAPSTFYKSCQNSKIITLGRDAFLQADCRKINGKYNRSEIKLEGIYNDDGTLRFSGGKESASFQRSCARISVQRSTLSAICRKKNGQLRNTSIVLNDIHNRDGRLTY
ncbi:MAG: CVNH domain-containing protein [Oscillatoria sp. PMC 1068.18]|nr:CVNH domain-containing protein [Oscillatoria sp. PMC 1076.18]MEC4989025.1 CVNH domain-containing protein [Oscillatoria sp. PMC 1068.18]